MHSGPFDGTVPLPSLEEGRSREDPLLVRPRPFPLLAPSPTPSTSLWAPLHSVPCRIAAVVFVSPSARAIRTRHFFFSGRWYHSRLDRGERTPPLVFPRLLLPPPLPLLRRHLLSLFIQPDGVTRATCTLLPDHLTSHPSDSPGQSGSNGVACPSRWSPVPRVSFRGEEECRHRSATVIDPCPPGRDLGDDI